MFAKFSRKKVVLQSTNNGIVHSISTVADDIFSSKAMGDGVVIESEEEVIYSPCDGYIRVIPETKHAVMMESNGVEILIHVGIDTCKSAGRGFELYVEVDNFVKAGDPIMKFNREFFKSIGVNTDVIIVLTNCLDKKVKLVIDKEVRVGSVIAEIH